MAKKRKTKKERLIECIKTIIEQDGSFTIGEIDGASSPIWKSMNDNHNALLEKFYKDSAKAIFYVHEQETDSEDVEYKDLSIDILEEILSLAEEWSVICYKTMKRASSN